MMRDPPVATVKPPSSLMLPEKVLLALVMVRALLPKAILPSPTKVIIEAPALVGEISKVPYTVTDSELAIEPLPERIKVASGLITVGKG